LMILMLTGVRWNLNAVLICICFMDKDVKHFSMCLLAICSSSENYLLLNSLANLLSGLFLLLVILYILSINPLSEQ
jgi:hypothetical protein